METNSNFVYPFVDVRWNCSKLICLHEPQQHFFNLGTGIKPQLFYIGCQFHRGVGGGGNESAINEDFTLWRMIEIGEDPAPPWSQLFL